MPDVATAYVQVVPTTKGIKEALTNEISGSGDTGGAQIGAKIKKALVVAGIGTAVGGAIKSAISGIGSLAEYGDNIDKLSQKMGLSAEAYQEWDAVMQHSGTSMESMKSSMKTLANAAEGGNKAFEAIGLTLEEVGNMSQQELFEATIAGLQGVEDSTQRTYLAGQLLGKGATELGALLNTSAEDTQAMRDRVHELGGVMSDDAVKAAAAYQDSLQDMQTAVSGLGRGMLAEFLPAATQIMDGITMIFSGDSGQGVAMISDAIISIGTKIGEAIPGIVSVAGDLIAQLGGAIIDHLPDILEAGLKIGGELLTGLVNAIPDILAKIPEILKQLADKFLEYDWKGLGSDILAGIGAGISSAVSSLVETAKSAVGGFVDGIKKRFEIGSPSKLMAREVGQYIPAGIAQGILDNAGIITDAMSDLTDMSITANVNGYRPGSTYNQGEAMAKALSRSDKVEVTVVLAGDTAKMFKVVDTENTRRTKATNYNQLAWQR